ncbi:MAG: adenosylcobinamide-GDP ribazoletransferase [Actinomycetota bacterium]
MRGREARIQPSAGGKGPRRAAIAAVAFLTRLPVDRRGGVEPADVARGVVVFPLAGAAIGGVAAGVAWTTAQAFPAIVAAIIAVASELVLTGGLHVDGLADTADGYGGATRERALEIMRDHSTGSYGTAAMLVDLLLKSALVAGLVNQPRGLWMLVAAGALSRGAAAVLGAAVPYAREDGGIGQVLSERAAPMSAWITGVLAVAIAWAAGGMRGLIGAVAVTLAAGLWAWRCRRRLGGITGDTLGATVEGAAAIVLLAGLAFR